MVWGKITVCQWNLMSLVLLYVFYVKILEQSFWQLGNVSATCPSKGTFGDAKWVPNAQACNQCLSLVFRHQLALPSVGSPTTVLVTIFYYLKILQVFLQYCKYIIVRINNEEYCELRKNAEKEGSWEKRALILSISVQLFLQPKCQSHIHVAPYWLFAIKFHWFFRPGHFQAEWITGSFSQMPLACFSVEM